MNIALVVPTGVGASIGGFIGDAAPVAQAFGYIADLTIIHPNVVNGAVLYGAGPRSLYVDGYTLDEFFASRLLLGPPLAKRVGLILDSMNEEQKTVTLNAANACCAVCGIEMVGYAECLEPTRGIVTKTRLGHFTGEILNPSVLFEAAERLMAAGAQALAVVTAVEGIASTCWADHYHSSAANPVGATEALISRAITWKTGLPCAHAPAYIDAISNACDIVDPRAAAEVIAKSGLPCVLRGLAFASAGTEKNGVSVNDLSAIIVPFDCAGGMPAVAASAHDIPLVAVKGNRCLVGVNADQLKLPTLIVVENYAEALAYVAALKAGVSWSSLLGTSVPIRSI